MSRFAFFFSSRRRHTRCGRDWSSDVCSADLRQRPASGAASSWLTGGGLARIGVATLLLGLLAALRHATWQGPVVFRLPDVQWLLSAPIDRGALVRLRLARALAAGVAAGALLGLGTFVLLEAELGVPARPLLAAALLGP